MGDQLEARSNPLAIKMRLRSDGAALKLDPLALAEALPNAGGRVVVLVHGLCMGDLQWKRDGADFGAALARDLGVTPIHLHYNSGRHISTNGREFAALMDALVRAWPVPLESIDLVTHSMGGLVARSALHQADQDAQEWPRRVGKLVFLGTQHHGAPLERSGQRLNILLSLSPYTEPFMRLGQVRSAGITDLRFGNLLDSDWKGLDRFALRADGCRRDRRIGAGGAGRRRPHAAGQRTRPPPRPALRAAHSCKAPVGGPQDQPPAVADLARGLRARQGLAVRTAPGDT